MNMQLAGHFCPIAKTVGVEGWHDFFVAEVGASAALAGLLIVAISINVKEIIGHDPLPDLAGHSLVILLASLMSASIALLPARLAAIAPALAIVALANWFAALLFLRRYVTAVRAWQAASPDRPLQYVLSFSLSSQVATLPLAVGGILAINGAAQSLYWIAAGILCSFLSAIYNTWVLLIEILR